jgi:hypothetical protein
MKGMLWPLPETEDAREWARLARSEDVKAFLDLLVEQRQYLLEALATEPDNDTRTWLQGQCEALNQVLILPGECEQAIKRLDAENQEEEDGPRVREWLRKRIGLFRGV